jgi:hypothetical protein
MRALTPRAIRLGERMRAAGEAALRNVPSADLTSLAAEIRSLRAILGGTGAGVGAPPDRVREAIAEYRRTGRLADVRSARLVCWGTTVRNSGQPPLIEDGDRFEPLIDEVDGFRAMRRPYRRCWRGLLDGYIGYDPDAGPEVGRRNWTLLRTYLNDNLPELERSGRSPDWLHVIDEHANILGERPCDRYGAELLEDGAGVIEPLWRELSAGDSSWIGRRIFEAQIEAAVAFDDRRLRSVMSRVLTLIEEHPLLADDALARILDRYAGCASTEIEPDLRDASVARWGNPWLERNDTRWTLVEAETRQMVSSWLKLRLIEDFFGLLSEDGINDQRRIDFWKRYVDRISDMHFALGDAAYSDNRPDFRSLRQSMKGRLLRLESGGRNNAFIMRIGGHVVVEFGEKGNAMFAFDAGSLPFDLRRASVAGNRTALKHPSHVARMVHTDSAGERWERKIERRMAELGAGRPTEQAGRSPASQAVIPRTKPTEWRAPEARSTQAPPADHVAFLARSGIKTLDSRDKGGTLWAYAPGKGPASAELIRRGFVWSERRGAWYLKA